MIPLRTSGTAGLTAALAAFLAIALLAAPACAANRQIAIGDYKWSDPDVHIDLGEHVTWNWVGPDLMHSVTGTSANDAGEDSDPGTNQPHHQPGDNFQLTFDQPGTYTFQCKLHPSVRGVVTVSAVPGDPRSEPDPVPKSNIDLTPPRLRHVRLGANRFGRHGTSLKFSVGERGKLDAEIYRFDDSGHRQYQGYRVYGTHVGFNGVRLARRSRHFRPRPGRYVAVLRATDNANNAADPRRVHFTIRKR